MTTYRMIATDGNHRMIDGATVDTFAAELRGALLAGSHAEYEAARRVWNGMIDRRPALIARCLGTQPSSHAQEMVRSAILPTTLRLEPR